MKGEGRKRKPTEACGCMRTHETCVHRDALHGEGRKAGAEGKKKGVFRRKRGGVLCAFRREMYAAEHSFFGAEGGREKNDRPFSRL